MNLIETKEDSTRLKEAWSKIQKIVNEEYPNSGSIKTRQTIPIQLNSTLQKQGLDVSEEIGEMTELLGALPHELCGDQWKALCTLTVAMDISDQLYRIPSIYKEYIQDLKNRS